MTIRWSAIHEQLGEPPRDIDFGLIAAAVEHGVVEVDSLDWKASLPGREEQQMEEFAKDAAALGNTRGGLVVYGVAEERGTGRAKEITGVDASEASQRRLRQLAASRIHPFLPGAQVVPLSSDDGHLSVLVLSVPRSPDAPHFVGHGNRLGVPFRAGPETQWMAERDIERAYAERFRTREDESTRLLVVLAEVEQQLLMEDRAWIVGVARPRTPVAAIAGAPRGPEIRDLLEAVLKRSVETLPTHQGMDRYLLIRQLGSESLNPRVGLRRWVVRTTASSEPDALSSAIHLELHHDGSVALAVALNGWFPPVLEGRYDVILPLVESFAADFVALSETYGRHLGEQSPLSFKLDLVRGDEGKPFAAVDRGRYGNFISGTLEQVSGSRNVRRFVQVDGEVPITADAETLRAVARTAAQDVLHQFGVARLSLLT